MKRAICPSCQKVNGVPLLWGYPDNESLDLSARGEVALGGCILNNANLDRHCRSCGHQWESSLFPQNERTSKGRTQAKSNKRAKSKPHVKTKPEREVRPREEVLTDKPKQKASRPKKSVSVLPALIVFVLALLTTFALAGTVICGDGWASSSIGRSGACSHHGGVNRLPQTLAFVFSFLVAFIFHIHRQERANRS